MTNDAIGMPSLDRSYLNFKSAVRKSFAFLDDLGFVEVESSPTLIRFRKGGVEIDVYHGRQSYEIGAGVTGFGARFSMSEIIYAIDPVAGKQYRGWAATTPATVVSGVENLGALMQLFGVRALNGDPIFFSELAHLRKSRSAEYAFDALVEQVRPKAEDAFRRRDYATAADLYARIRSRLSPAEVKKLTLAERRRSI